MNTRKLFLVAALAATGNVMLADDTWEGGEPVVRTFDEFCLDMNPKTYLVGEVLVLRAMDPSAGLVVEVANLGRRFIYTDIVRPDAALRAIEEKLHEIADFEKPYRQQHGLYVVSSSSGTYDGKVLAAHVDHETRAITITRAIHGLEHPLAPDKVLNLDPIDRIMYEPEIPGEQLVVEVIAHGYPD